MICQAKKIKDSRKSQANRDEPTVGGRLYGFYPTGVYQGRSEVTVRGVDSFELERQPSGARVVLAYLAESPLESEDADYRLLSALAQDPRNRVFATTAPNPRYAAHAHMVYNAISNAELTSGLSSYSSVRLTSLSDIGALVKSDYGDSQEGHSKKVYGVGVGA